MSPALASAPAAQDRPPSDFQVTVEDLQRQYEQMAPHEFLTTAWPQFHRACEFVLRKLVQRYPHLDAHDIDDVLQEVWLQIVVKLTAFKEQGTPVNLRGWLWQVVRSKAFDRQRQCARHHVANLDILIATRQEPAARTADPSVMGERAAQVAWMHALIERLRHKVSALNFRIFSLRMLEELPVEEVALMVGLTRNQVWYRQYRTQNKLRAMAG